jgi:putative NADPH-quinone reductase
MKVLVVNGSARKEKGYTAKILDPFIKGMEKAGAQVELLYSKKLDVNPCNGEFDCWYENVGECYIDDGMQQVYPKLREADILVLGMPVYFPIPSELQKFLNRLMPLMNPVLKFKDGRTQIKCHDDVRIRKIVLVSVCGWWEMGNFDLVEHIVREICLKAGVEFAGSVLRPHADILPKEKVKAGEVFGALEELGFCFIKDGSLSEDLLKVIAQPLISEYDCRKRLTRE